MSLSPWTDSLSDNNMKKTYKSPTTNTIKISLPRPIVASGAVQDNGTKMRLQNIERRDASEAASRFNDDWDWED